MNIVVEKGIDEDNDHLFVHTLVARVRLLKAKRELRRKQLEFKRARYLKIKHWANLIQRGGKEGNMIRYHEVTLCNLDDNVISKRLLETMLELNNGASKWVGLPEKMNQ